MGGVSIFGKYCKEILGGGSEKKFPQRKNQFPQRKNFHNEKINFHNEKISTTKKSISTTKKSTLFIEKFPQRKINFII